MNYTAWSRGHTAVPILYGCLAVCDRSSLEKQQRWLVMVGGGGELKGKTEVKYPL
jgi:hypothetical protein